MKRNEKMLRKVFEAYRNTPKSPSLQITPKQKTKSKASLFTRAENLIEQTTVRKKLTTMEASNSSPVKTDQLEVNSTANTSQNTQNIIEILTNDILLPSHSSVEELYPVSIDNTETLHNIVPMDSEKPISTPEAPLYSPITPIDRNVFLAGGKLVTSDTIAPIDLEEALSTPEAPLYSPITPIDRNIFLAEGSVRIPENRENSSPVRAMSPETLKLLQGLNFSDDDDDSIQDPAYIPEFEDENSPANESNEVNASFSQPQFQVPSKLLKRRCSENDLQQEQPLIKKIRRRASMSGAIYEQNMKPKSSSPKKKHVSNPNNWKRCIERNKRLRGEAYKTTKGKCVAATPMKQPKCLALEKHKCNANVPEDSRKQIYDTFRAMGSLEAQRQFIIKHVTRENKKRSTKNGPSRKVSTHKYSFTVDSKKVTVCRDFFLETLNIKEGIVRGALKKISEEGVLLADKRGKQPPANKLSTERLDLIKKHIFSFPAMESHYCRKNTEYRYLDSELNVTIMCSLYKKKCEEEGAPPAGIETYRKVFRSYKLRFHVPKKDLCKKCVAYKELKNNDPSNSEHESHSKHLKRRDDAYLRRDADKAAAKDDLKTLAFNFDLEAVLQTPKGASGPFFYVRKLAVYNLTFYKFGDQDVDCFTWDETEGKRGSVEIASCVYKYICSRNQGITHVRMMSDNCGGQQKNFNFCCMLLHLVTNHSTINIIDHVFYESGHSHMECDSIHSKIEQKCKNTAIYTPDGWIQVMRVARSNPRPFNVNVLVHDDFLDFNPNQCQFAEEILKKTTQKKKSSNKRKKNNEQDQNEELDETRPNVKINFQDAVWIQYRKDNPKSIFIKTDYNDAFKELKLKPKRGKSTAIVPSNVYTQRIPISKAKKRDLLKLCRDNQIPKYYHSFYENLPDSEGVQDRLPEPDHEEEEEL